MLLTEQQRAELERRGYGLAGPNDCIIVGGWLNIDLCDPATIHKLRQAVEMAAVLGIAPPGYSLMPQEAAKRALRHIEALRKQAADHLEMCEAAAKPGDDTWTRIIEEARQSVAEIVALASALQGKGVEKR